MRYPILIQSILDHLGELRVVNAGNYLCLLIFYLDWKHLHGNAASFCDAYAQAIFGGTSRAAWNDYCSALIFKLIPLSVELVSYLPLLLT